MDEHLQELLEKEKQNYSPIIAFTRMFTGHLRNFDEHFPMEAEMQMHLDACRDYFMMFGSIKGEESPWTIKEE